MQRKELIFATTNPAKVDQIKGALALLPIDVRGLEKNKNLPEVIEDGETSLENAIIKATNYAKFLNQPVFSMDVGLFIDGLTEKEQPGVHVRRIPGFEGRPSDQQVLNYYVKLVARLGTNISGRWDFGVCIANPRGFHVETTIPSHRIFSSSVSPVVVEGYPLESIQIDPVTKKFVSEMSKDEQAKYWQRVIGKPLEEFIKEQFLHNSLFS